MYFARLTKKEEHSQKTRIALVEALDILLKSKKIVLNKNDSSFIQFLKQELRNDNAFKKGPAVDSDKLLEIFKKYKNALGSYEIAYYLKRASGYSFYVYDPGQDKVIDSIGEEAYSVLVRRYQYFNEFKNDQLSTAYTHKDSYNIYKYDKLPGNMVLTKRAKMAWERGVYGQGYVACMYPDKDMPYRWLVDIAPAFNAIKTQEDKARMRDKYGLRYTDKECVYSEEKRGGNTGVVHKKLKELYHLSDVEPVLGFGLMKGSNKNGLDFRLFIQSGNMNEPNINRNPEHVLCFWFDGQENFQPLEHGYYNSFYIKRCLPREIAEQIATSMVDQLYQASNRIEKVGELMLQNKKYFARNEKQWLACKNDPYKKCELLVNTITFALGIGLDKPGVPSLEEALYFLELNCRRILELRGEKLNDSDMQYMIRELRNHYLLGHIPGTVNPVASLIAGGKLEALKILYQTIGGSLSDMLNIEDGLGMTPLMAAVEYNRLDIVEFLVSLGVDIERPNRDGCNAFQYAARIGNMTMAYKLLLEYRKELKNTDRYLPTLLIDFQTIIKSIRTKSEAQIVDAFDELIRQAFPSDEIFNSCLLSVLTSRPHYIENSLKYMMASSFIQGKMNAKNKELLTKMNSIMNSHDRYAFLNSITYYKSSRPQQRYASYEDRLFRAECSGSESVVSYWLEAGDNPNIPLSSGETPLHLAAARGHTKIVHALLEKKADPNIAIKDKGTPLFLAVSEGRYDVCKELIKGGAIIDSPVRLKKNHMRYINLKYIDILDELFIGKKLNIYDSLDGVTPFHLAVLQGNAKLVEMFINEGCDVNAKIMGKISPLEIAYALENEYLILLLQVAMASPSRVSRRHL